jgi:rhodanese-related sulfurtransferase
MKPWHIVLVLIVALIVWQMLGARPDVDGAAARDLVKKGAKLVDVRTTGEFAAGHIDGAVNVPIAELGERLDDVGKPSDTIVLYCASGMRSSKAAKLLREKGFGEVHNLGAMQRW